MITKDLRAHFQAAGIDPKYADIIELQAQPCLRLDAIPTDESHMQLGCSKIGGAPDLPKTASWPEHRGRLLDFFVQFDLQDFNQYPICSVLPPKGHLYFFGETDLWSERYDPTDRGNWRLIYHPGPQEELERHVLSEGGLTPPRFNPCRIIFHEALSPGWHETPIRAFHLDEAQEDQYVDTIYELPEGKAHQLLGRPGRIENREDDFQLQCQAISHGLVLGADGRPLDKNRLRELAAGAADWKLLLQLDSDEGAGMNWGDSMISFWIKEKDLQDRNFSEVWMIEEWF